MADRKAGAFELPGIVSLKASIDAWDQVDAILRQSLQTYARTLGHIESHLSKQASERFNVEGLDFTRQRAALTTNLHSPDSSLSLLHRVSCEVESELQTFGERLFLNACSSQDLQDVANVLAQAITGILDVSSKHETDMRTAASRLRTASESDNVTALRVLVRYQSTQLVRLADEAARESQQLANGLRTQVAELTAGLKLAQEDARHDPLTGLLNRRALKEIMAEFAKTKSPRCMILLDLDRFKSINDKFGSLAGDELLRQVALRIQSALHPACAVARWGADVFIVVVDGTISAGMSLAQQLDQRLRNRYNLGSGNLSSVFAQASVGLSDWKCGEDADIVIQRADQALKAKKRQVQDKAHDPVG